MKRKKHSTLSKNWDEFSATNFLPRVVREPICGGKGRFTFVRGANPSPLCWDLATTIRARQPIYTAHPILIYAQPAPPFSRKQRNFHFHFLEREILIGDLWNSTNEFNLSVLTLGRFLNIKQNFDWNDASLETNSHFIIFFATLWKKKSHLNISFQLHFMAFINSHAVPLS